MKEEDRLLGLQELMKVAAKIDTLARQAWDKSRAHRIIGRLGRDPDDIGAMSHFMVERVKEDDENYLKITGGQDGWLLLQISMQQVSRAMWEQLWNDAHPDRWGEAWDGEDFELRSVWREKVRAMIRECHQEAILKMSAEEYFAQLKTAGESEEVAENLLDWISVINEEDAPST